MTTTTAKFVPIPLDDAIRKADLDANLGGRVAHELLELISRHFNPKLRLPPIRQIADELDVSIGTVNQAVKQLVADGILVTRHRAGTVLAPGCTIEHVRRRIERRGDAHVVPALVRVLLADDCDMMAQEMADSFARVIADNGARVRFENYPRRFYKEPVAQDDSDATAMIHPQHWLGPIPWKAPTPLVIASTNMYDVDAEDGFDQVSIDDEHGAYLAGRRLRATGHRSVCYIGRRRYDLEEMDTYDDLAARRLRGFERGWGETVPEAHRIYGGSHDLHHGATAFGDYMAISPRPEAVFCDTDDFAIGFHIGAFTQKLRAGRDFSLIGFDKQQLAMSIPTGPLTTVEVPREEIGRRAAELLLDRIQHPDQPARRIALGCTLFEGNTLVDHRKDHTS